MLLLVFLLSSSLFFWFLFPFNGLVIVVVLYAITIKMPILPSNFYTFFSSLAMLIHFRVCVSYIHNFTVHINVGSHNTYTICAVFIFLFSGLLVRLFYTFSITIRWPLDVLYVPASTIITSIPIRSESQQNDIKLCFVERAYGVKQFENVSMWHCTQYRHSTDIEQSTAINHLSTYKIDRNILINRKNVLFLSIVFGW